MGYQPINADGSRPPAFMFHIEGPNKIESNCDITDHYTENNKAIQDHIAHRPILVTVHGYIGELNDVPPNSIFNALKVIAGLPIISDFSPSLSVSAKLAYNKAFQGYQAVSNLANAGVSAWSSISGNGGPNAVGSNGLGNSFNPQTGNVGNNQNQQQIMFQRLLGYQQANSLFNVQTPWAIVQNMAILSLMPEQDELTQVVTNFIVVFKQIRFASTLDVHPPMLLPGPVADSGSAKVDQGSSVPKPSLVSHLAKIAGIR
jgi:hypothetical protein